jgi:hypothetical protein
VGGSNLKVKNVCKERGNQQRKAHRVALFLRWHKALKRPERQAEKPVFFDRKAA